MHRAQKAQQSADGELRLAHGHVAALTSREQEGQAMRNGLEAIESEAAATHRGVTEAISTAMARPPCPEGLSPPAWSQPTERAEVGTTEGLLHAAQPLVDVQPPVETPKIPSEAVGGTRERWLEIAMPSHLEARARARKAVHAERPQQPWPQELEDASVSIGEQQHQQQQQTQ